MSQQYVITITDLSSCVVKIHQGGKSSLMLQYGAAGRLVLSDNDHPEWSVSVPGGESDSNLHLPYDDRTDMVLPGSAHGKIVLSDGDHLQLNVRDPNGRSQYTMQLNGLVSDGQILDLAGGLTLFVDTESAALDFPVNLKAGSGSVLSMETAEIDLQVTRALSGHERLILSATGAIAVRKTLSGTQAGLFAGTASAKISAASLTVLSDWTEHLLSEMTEKTLDELMYKEV